MKQWEYLMKEISQRTVFFHEQYHKILWNVMVAWGAVLVLLSTLTKDGIGKIEDTKIMGIGVIIFCLFMIITIFFISVVVLYLSSLKDRRNQDEICKMAAYQIIFCEDKPIFNVEKDEVDEKKCWNWSLFELMREKKGQPGWNNKHTIHKPEFILSLFAILMEIFFIIIIFVNICNNTVKGIDWLVVVVCFICVIISGYLLYRISKNSVSQEKRFDMNKMYLTFFIKYAMEIGYYENEQVIKDKYGEGFWNEVMICK